MLIWKDLLPIGNTTELLTEIAKSNVLLHNLPYTMKGSFSAIEIIPASVLQHSSLPSSVIILISNWSVLHFMVSK